MATPGTYILRYDVTNAVGKSATAIERTVIVVPPPVTTDLYLEGTGPLTSSSSLLLSDAAPTASAARTQSSTGVSLSSGNPWKVVGTWSAAPAPLGGSLEAVNPLHVWLGLKNSDDQGTRFDVRAEILRNAALIASGESRCIQNLTTNDNQALEAIVTFAPFSPVMLDGQDGLSLRISTRIGTTSTDEFCGGHQNATGLRLYFASSARPSRFSTVTRN